MHAVLLKSVQIVTADCGRGRERPRCCHEVGRVGLWQLQLCSVRIPRLFSRSNYTRSSGKVGPHRTRRKDCNNSPDYLPDRNAPGTPAGRSIGHIPGVAPIKPTPACSGPGFAAANTPHIHTSRHPQVSHLRQQRETRLRPTEYNYANISGTCKTTNDCAALLRSNSSIIFLICHCNI